MLLDLDTRHYSEEDCTIIRSNLEDIIQYGLKIYKKKHNKKLTKYEQALYDIFKENSTECLKREDIVKLYNEKVYGKDKSKYMKTQNITTKINRINRKLQGVKIANKFGYGYYILIV